MKKAPAERGQGSQCRVLETLPVQSRSLDSVSQNLIQINFSLLSHLRLQGAARRTPPFRQPRLYESGFFFRGRAAAMRDVNHRFRPTETANIRRPPRNQEPNEQGRSACETAAPDRGVARRPSIQTPCSIKQRLNQGLNSKNSTSHAVASHECTQHGIEAAAAFLGPVRCAGVTRHPNDRLAITDQAHVLEQSRGWRVSRPI